MNTRGTRLFDPAHLKRNHPGWDPIVSYPAPKLIFTDCTAQMSADFMAAATCIACEENGPVTPVPAARWIHNGFLDCLFGLCEPCFEDFARERAFKNAPVMIRVGGSVTVCEPKTVSDFARESDGNSE